MVLAVGAHPDDIDFGAAGTIAKWTGEGARVYYLVCTDGSRGSDDPGMTRKKLAQIRREEQVNAGRVLGIKKIFFLKHADTTLVSDFKLKKDIAQVIKTIKPNILLTMDPSLYYSEKFSFINHSDHRAAALAAMDACFPLSRDRLTFPDHERKGLFPHKTKELWLIGFEKRNQLVDVTKTFEKKLKALSMHKSQFPDFPAVKKKVEETARYFGEGLPAGKQAKGVKYAENFTRIVIS